MSRPSADEVRDRLASGFPEAAITVQDDSHLHAGHAGAQGGAGHYTVRIVSSRFAGLSSVARHRLVYHQVGDWIPVRVHALAIIARSPAESAGP
jgi:BolA protein